MEGKRIKFNNQEIKMLTSVIIEYIEIMEDGEYTHDYTLYMLNNGLGSAMRKLTNGRKGNCIYKKYPLRRESYHYPAFEDWMASRQVRRVEDGRE